MFRAHPVFVAHKGKAFQMVPRRDQSMLWRYGAVGSSPTRYEPYSGELPEELLEAMAEWPGPCAYWAGHCDDGPGASPLYHPDPLKTGFTYEAETYEANRAKKREEERAFEARVEHGKEFARRAVAWYLANRERLASEYMANPPAKIFRIVGSDETDWIGTVMRTTEWHHASHAMHDSYGSPYIRTDWYHFIRSQQ